MKGLGELLLQYQVTGPITGQPTNRYKCYITCNNPTRRVTAGTALASSTQATMLLHLRWVGNTAV
eukprot:1568977-Rhodomonas_salina.1